MIEASDEQKLLDDIFKTGQSIRQGYESTEDRREKQDRDQCEEGTMLARGIAGVIRRRSLPGGYTR